MARTKGIQVHPDKSLFIRQAHQLTRAAYDLPSTQMRILKVLIAQVQIRNSGLELLEVSTGDMLRALELHSGDYEFLRSHMRALRGTTLEMDTPDGWVMFGWVDRIEYVQSRDVFKFKLGGDLLPYILNLKEMWARVALANLNKLTGKYSSRLYEAVTADSGMSGRGGNKPGEWFTDIDFDDLRIRFKIAPNEYKLKNDFRRWVIDGPIREINEAGVGLTITADYDRFRRGRTLTGVRLLVKSSTPGEPRNVTPSHEEDEEEALKALNQKLYDKLLAEEPDDMFGGDLARQANAWRALLKHPDLNPLPKKRSRKAST